MLHLRTKAKATSLGTSTVMSTSKERLHVLTNAKAIPSHPSSIQCQQTSTREALASSSHFRSRQTIRRLRTNHCHDHPPSLTNTPADPQRPLYVTGTASTLACNSMTQNDPGGCVVISASDYWDVVHLTAFPIICEAL